MFWDFYLFLLFIGKLYLIYEYCENGSILIVMEIYRTLCNFINYRRHLLISKTIHSHPQIKPESELIRTVDERVQNQSKSQQTK